MSKTGAISPNNPIAGKAVTLKNRPNRTQTYMRNHNIREDDSSHNPSLPFPDFNQYG